MVSTAIRRHGGQTNGGEAVSEAMELLPCPFCGVIDVSCVPAEDDPNYDADYDVVAECISCGSRGPTDEHKTGDDAIAAWNRRHSPKGE